MEQVNLQSCENPVEDEEQHCFLCESLLRKGPISVPPLLAKKISLCKKFLKNIGDTEEGKNYQKSCPTCLIEVRKVWNLNLAITTIRQQITDILKKQRDFRKISSQQNSVRKKKRLQQKTRIEDGFINDQISPCNSNHAKNYACDDDTVNSSQLTSTSIPCVKLETSSIYPVENGIDVVDSIFVGGGGGPPLKEEDHIFAETDPIADDDDPTLLTDDDTNFMEFEDVEVMPTFESTSPSPAVPTATTSPRKRRSTKTSKRALRHKCLQCDRAFTYPFKLVEHVRSAHEKIRYPCSVCGKVLSSARHCAAHEATLCGVVHPTELLKKLYVTLHPCVVAGCTKVFASKSNLDTCKLTIRQFTELTLQNIFVLQNNFAQNTETHLIVQSLSRFAM